MNGWFALEICRARVAGVRFLNSLAVSWHPEKFLLASVSVARCLHAAKNTTPSKVFALENVVARVALAAGLHISLSHTELFFSASHTGLVAVNVQSPIGF